MMVLFALLFKTTFQTKSSTGQEWTYEEFSNSFIDDVITTETEKQAVFTGFIDIWWSFAILFQMMTLDQWAD